MRLPWFQKEKETDTSRPKQIFLFLIIRKRAYEKSFRFVIYAQFWYKDNMIILFSQCDSGLTIWSSVSQFDRNIPYPCVAILKPDSKLSVETKSWYLHQHQLILFQTVLQQQKWRIIVVVPMQHCQCLVTRIVVIKSLLMIIL